MNTRLPQCILCARKLDRPLDVNRPCCPICESDQNVSIAIRAPAVITGGPDAYKAEAAKRAAGRQATVLHLPEG